MKIDLCKLLGVKEGEEFKIDVFPFRNNKYKVYKNELQFKTEYDEFWRLSDMGINNIVNCKVIKLPKKKEFTDDELAVFRCMDKKYKWATRDRRYGLTVFENKPKKITNNREEYWKTSGDWLYLGCFENMFQAITTEDEEPVYIDDYVERGAENE